MVEITVDPGKDFRRALDKVYKKSGDLTIPFTLMTKQWFKGNRSIFDLGRKGPGKYIDLSPKYKRRKSKILGSPYPILVGFTRARRRSGKLRESMVNPSSKNAFNKIANKKHLFLGTRAKSRKGALYPAFLNNGTGKMPARPFMLIGGEQVATPEVNKRREAWVKTLNDYVLQLSGIIGDVS
ncbi:hypothetical protein KAR91_40770 [Candidatus Pacearchaeota archaeon]|nr:hypothetical protein [Candidatus Pacearchaeota archaeon]